MEEYIDEEAYELSLGQKQRITIAGVISISPKYIIMDEPTAMLDPEGKEDIRKIVKELKKQGFTIIYITNIIDEIFISDRVIMLEKGSIIKEFKTKDILENIEFLKEHGITIPKAIEIMRNLKAKGIEVSLEELI
ncbi:MAG: ATP-binding cassette domain-containing protein [Clostridia bacterium]|nr:ATP-binding cassette domain-containing protein [Clostridia bacterium]